jgi:hypothetical protein
MPFPEKFLHNKRDTMLISMISTKNLKIIIKAIKDGYKGNLGKREI